jgi:hypothetical protein
MRQSEPRNPDRPSLLLAFKKSRTRINEPKKNKQNSIVLRQKSHLLKKSCANGIIYKWRHIQYATEALTKYSTIRLSCTMIYLYAYKIKLCSCLCWYRMSYNSPAKIKLGNKILQFSANQIFLAFASFNHR